MTKKSANKLQPFNRYEGSEPESSERRMPSAMLDSRSSARSVGELMGRLEDYSKNQEQWHAEYPWAKRFVMGYPLPSWQRELVWTEEQKVRFITSLWEEVDVGSYLLNDQFELQGKVYREFSEVLLDGQQRLSALQSYLTNEFAVPDGSGKPCFWHELSRVERRFFANKTFARAGIHSWNEKELRRAYDLRSFGGTPHKESERASRD